MRVGAAARDVWEGWRGHPGRLAPVLAALLGGMVSLMLLWAALGALRAEADRLESGLGADGFLVEATGRGAGWSAEQAEMLARALDGAGVLCAITDEWAENGGFPVYGVAGDLAGARAEWQWEGRAPDALDVHGGGGGGCWLERGAAERQGLAAGDVVVVGGRGMAVAGLYETGGGWVPGLAADAVFVPAGTGARFRRLVARATGPGGVGAATARLREALAGPFERPMDEDGREAECLWLTPDVVLGEVRHWQRTVQWGGGLAAGLALGLAAVTLACIQLLGVRERRTEIGLRRALGATRGEVAGLFFLESVGLAVVAALVAGAGLLALRGWLAEVLPVPLRFTAGTWAGPLAIAVALVGVCSALPAHAAAGVEPAAGVRE